MNNGITVPSGCKEADLVYKVIGERKLELTFLPPYEKKYDKAPLYFVIPGGGWHMEKRADMIDFSLKSIETLRNEGFAVVGIDYRVYSEENVVMRDIISDCFDAMRYIAHYADILEIDKKRVVMSGHSAGGHLALMLSYAPHDMFRNDSMFDDEFNVVISAPISPPTILYNDNVPVTLNFNPTGAYKDNDTEEERRATSPVTYVNENSPATLLTAGTSDRLVYSNSSEILYDMLCEKNIKCKLVHSIGGGHVFEQIHKQIEPTPSRDEIQDIISEFVLENI